MKSRAGPTSVTHVSQVFIVCHENEMGSQHYCPNSSKVRTGPSDRTWKEDQIVRNERWGTNPTPSFSEGHVTTAKKLGEDPEETILKSEKYSQRKEAGLSWEYCTATWASPRLGENKEKPTCRLGSRKSEHAGCLKCHEKRTFFIYFS